MPKDGLDKNGTLRFIQERQRTWADSAAIQYLPNGRVVALSDNLFALLNAATVAEYEAADGDEMGRGNIGGKMFRTRMQRFRLLAGSPATATSGGFRNSNRS